MTVQSIYETKGRAREYSELACNIFSFCTHGCAYCYVPQVLYKTRDAFSKGEYTRITVQDILKSAKQWADKGETRNVLFCFTCDPYQPIEQDTMIMRKSIIALHEVGLHVTILTKAGLNSTRDFDLLTPKDVYATTLTCVNDSDSKFWEKNAALPKERIGALELAHSKGIETWVSLEPVIYPEQAKELIKLTKDFTGHYKVSKLNYINQLPLEYQEIVKDIDWYKFGWEIKEFMDGLGVKYYFKNDLLKAMRVKPEEFNQTWVCR